MFFTIDDIINKMLPSKIGNIQEAICLSPDEVMAVMRHFKWNEEKMQEKWFDNEVKIMHETGIKYNVNSQGTLEDNTSLEKNNKGFCVVCFADFKSKDAESIPISL